MDSIKLLEHVATKSDNARAALLPLIPQLNARYESYKELIPAGEIPAKSSSLPASAASVLIEAYASAVCNGFSFLGTETIRGRLLADAYECPYCFFGEPYHLDHFLPKKATEWPDFSVLLENLIPACARCNVRKGAKTFDLHPVLGPHVAMRFLKLTIEPQGFALGYKFEIDAGAVPPAYVAPLSVQFNELDLANRLGLQATKRVDTWRPYLHSALDLGGVDALRQLLSGYRRTAEQSHVDNHWLSLLTAALVSAPGFLHLQRWLGARHD